MSGRCHLCGCELLRGTSYVTVVRHVERADAADGSIVTISVEEATVCATWCLGHAPSAQEVCKLLSGRDSDRRGGWQAS